MNATITWKGKVQFSAIADSGHEIAIDGPPDLGGEQAGVRPMELMLLGLGGCSSFDVVNILTKGREHITDCVTQVTATRAEADPKVFTGIHLHFVISGQNLNERKIARAIGLSAEKYCSASIMLQRAGVDITHDYELRDV